MPRRTTGSVYRTADGYGIRWPEDGKRPQRTGFATKTEARRWFAANVAPRLDRGAPSPDITLRRVLRPVPRAPRRHRRRAHPRDARGAARPRAASVRRLDARRARGRRRRHRRWRAGLPDTSRYRLTLALRQALGAAVRWRYLARNPAVDAGPQPPAAQRGAAPFTPDEVDALEVELGPVFGPLVVFCRRDRAAHERVGRHSSAATSTARGRP